MLLPAQMGHCEEEKQQIARPLSLLIASQSLPGLPQTHLFSKLVKLPTFKGKAFYGPFSALLREKPFTGSLCLFPLSSCTLHGLTEAL